MSVPIQPTVCLASSMRLFALNLKKENDNSIKFSDFIENIDEFI